MVANLTFAQYQQLVYVIPGCQQKHVDMSSEHLSLRRLLSRNPSPLTRYSFHQLRSVTRLG